VLEGRALIRATLPYIREQPIRSWWCLISTATLFAAALAASALPFPWFLRLAAGILAGMTLCRLFIIYHDHQHGAILRGSRVASFFMTTFGILSLNPPSTWNASHNHHHKHNGKIRSASIGSFPVMTVDAYNRASRRERYYYAISRHPLTILFAWVTVFFVGMTLSSFKRKPLQHLDCLAAILIHIALWALLLFFAPWALLYSFIIPLLVGSAMGAYLFYVQHNFPAVDLGDQSDWDYVFAALRSSSFLDTTRIMHWFTGNIGYHHIHHLNARVPFYRLPEAMKALPELQVPGRTNLNPWTILSCLRLKLWDPELRRMVGFKGASLRTGNRLRPDLLPDRPAPAVLSGDLSGEL
jgi:acyl-lipid omega-6 desaturase (Delta-12 desaturase)